ncbi:unnamed protein product [Bathycoccus prasinos]
MISTEFISVSKPSRDAFSVTNQLQVLWKKASERVRTPSSSVLAASRGVVEESGGKFHLRLNIGERPIANKYREGKDEKTFEKRVKKYLKLLRGKRFKPAGAPRACRSDSTGYRSSTHAPGAGQRGLGLWDITTSLD